MTGESLLGKGRDGWSGAAVGAGDQRRLPGLGPGLGSERRARVGDAGVFHERAFSLCRASPGAPAAPPLAPRHGGAEWAWGVVCVRSVFQISFVNYGEIPLLPLRCKDKTSWEEHQSSVSRLP